MKVLLVQPRPQRGLGLTRLIYPEPLGLESIAAYLPQHDVKIVDIFRLEDVHRVRSSFQPDLCGISCLFTPEVYKAIAIADAIKSNGNKPFVLVGGHHASLNPCDLWHRSIDAIAIGEGEMITKEVVACLEANGDPRTVPGLVLNEPEGQVSTEPRQLVENLDQLPLPARHLTQPWRKRYFDGLNRPFALVETARGCPYRCRFCSVHQFHKGRVRVKSPGRVAEELASVRERAVLFTDDNFFLDPVRSLEIATLLRQEGIKRRFTIQARSDTIARHPELVSAWKEVGLVNVFVGMEKIDDQQLRLLDKRTSVESNERALEVLSSKGVGVTPSFIVDPEASRQDFLELGQYIRSHRIKGPIFAVLTPLPGTELFTEVKETLTTNNYELFDLGHAVLPTRLPLPEFYAELSRLYRVASSQYGVVLDTARDVIKRLLSCELSLSHLARIAARAKSHINPRFYLQAHGEIPCLGPGQPGGQPAASACDQALRQE